MRPALMRRLRDSRHRPSRPQRLRRPRSTRRAPQFAASGGVAHIADDLQRCPIVQRHHATAVLEQRRRAPGATHERRRWRRPAGNRWCRRQQRRHRAVLHLGAAAPAASRTWRGAPAPMRHSLEGIEVLRGGRDEALPARRHAAGQLAGGSGNAARRDGDVVLHARRGAVVDVESHSFTPRLHAAATTTTTATLNNASQQGCMHQPPAPAPPSAPAGSVSNPPTHPLALHARPTDPLPAAPRAGRSVRASNPRDSDASRGTSGARQSKGGTELEACPRSPTPFGLPHSLFHVCGAKHHHNRAATWPLDATPPVGNAPPPATLHPYRLLLGTSKCDMPAARHPTSCDQLRRG